MITFFASALLAGLAVLVWLAVFLLIGRIVEIVWEGGDPDDCGDIPEIANHEPEACEVTPPKKAA